MGRILIDDDEASDILDYLLDTDDDKACWLAEQLFFRMRMIDTFEEYCRKRVIGRMANPTKPSDYGLSITYSTDEDMEYILNSMKDKKHE